jgi:hypothetical protein
LAFFRLNKSKLYSIYSSALPLISLDKLSYLLLVLLLQQQILSSIKSPPLQQNHSSQSS